MRVQDHWIVRSNNVPQEWDDCAHPPMHCVGSVGSVLDRFLEVEMALKAEEEGWVSSGAGSLNDH